MTAAAFVLQETAGGPCQRANGRIGGGVGALGAGLMCLSVVDMTLDSILSKEEIFLGYDRIGWAKVEDLKETRNGRVDWRFCSLYVSIYCYYLYIIICIYDTVIQYIYTYL